MIRRVTPLAFALAALLGWVLFLGVLIDRAELFIAAVPLAVALLALGGDGGALRFELRLELSADRLAEGDRLLVTVTVAAIDALPAIEILVALPPLLEARPAIIASSSASRRAGRPAGAFSCCARRAAGSSSANFICGCGTAPA